MYKQQIPSMKRKNEKLSSLIRKCEYVCEEYSEM